MLPWFAVVVTGLLMASAFPPLEWSELGFLALVPLLLTLRRMSPRKGFIVGWWAGWIFWLCSIFWLTKVTVGGWLLLTSYCALYTGLFAGGTAWLLTRLRSDFLGHRLLVLAVLPLAWAGFEFLRGTLFTGFPWNPLGVSQYARISLIQSASWGGVYAVSAVVMLVNVAAWLTIEQYVREGVKGRRAWHPELMIVFLVLAVLMTQGGRAMRALPPAATTVRAALVQPATPQDEKWTPELLAPSYARLGSLTELALRVGEPDIVIWPETAVLDYIRESEQGYALVYRLTRMGAPLLVGTMDRAWRDDGPPRYYNSSILFDEAGRIMQQYDKKHLVMFGEYVPLENIFPFLSTLTPIEGSFDPGMETTVFRLTKPDVSFSVLICFEDTIPALAREAVKAGARWLVNQTNDAWFDVSSANKQHMTHAVFRAIENRVPVTRVANTGVTCSIDRTGRIYDVLQDPAGQTLIEGFKMSLVDIPDENDAGRTVYARWGAWFGWTGAVAALMLMGGWGRDAYAARKSKAKERT